MSDWVIQQFDDLRNLLNVGLESNCISPKSLDLGNNLLSWHYRVFVVDDNLRSEVTQFDGYSCSNTAARASYEGYFAIETIGSLIGGHIWGYGSFRRVTVGKGAHIFHVMCGPWTFIQVEIFGSLPGFENANPRRYFGEAPRWKSFLSREILNVLIVTEALGRYAEDDIDWRLNPSGFCVIIRQKHFIH